MFRLGKNSLNTISTIIHSDTLFSALVINYLKLYGEDDSQLSLKDFIALFRKGNIKISSAFHCIEKVAENESEEKKKDSEYLYFLPKPDAYNLKEEDDNHKATKKVAFLSKGLWGKNPFNTHYEHIMGGTHAIDAKELEAFDLNQLKRGKILADVKLTGQNFLPKVVVHKKTQEDSYYSVSNVQLMPIQLKSKTPEKKRFLPIHFYFLMENEGLTDLQLKRLKACIYLLEDEGIGGERSVGCGRIEGVEFRDWEAVKIAEPPKGSDEKVIPFNARCTLSLTIPKNNTDFKKYDFYKLLKRGGSAIGVGTDNRYARKQVRMVKEGAIVSAEVEGSIADISPDKAAKDSILRYGKALTIEAFSPLKKIKNNEQQ